MNQPNQKLVSPSTIRKWRNRRNNVDFSSEKLLWRLDYCTCDVEGLGILWQISWYPSTVVDKIGGLDYIITWEKASDQSVESEDGMIGLGIVMPENYKMEYNEERHYAVAHFETVRGRKVSYAIGSCWSKGNIPSFDEWKKLVSY